MSDELHSAIGEANGKLDTLLTLVRDHIQADERKFAQIDKDLAAHATDINQAKGAKSALLWVAGGVATVAGGLGALAAKALGLH